LIPLGAIRKPEEDSHAPPNQDDCRRSSSSSSHRSSLLRLRHDAVVLDVLMPEPGGLEVCRAIRARGDDTPILMLTARDLVSDRVAGLDAGADD